MNIKPVKIVFVSSLLALSLPIYAQSEHKIIEPDIIYSQYPANYILGGLSIDELPGFDHNLLLSISGLEVGKTYSIPGPDITEAVRQYWSQKLFSNVSITADSIVDNKIYLHIHLTPHPRISKIAYHGVKSADVKALQKRLGLQDGSQITPDMLDRAKLIIKKFYDEKGFKNANINVTQKEDITSPGKVVVSIDIAKNSKVKVHKINIIGVTPAEARKIKAAMKKTHERSLINIFRSKKFIPEKYEEDKDNLISALNSLGYRDAIILKDTVQKTNKDNIVDINIQVNKGKKYYLDHVTWVGNKVYSTELLSHLLQMKKGDVYNQEKLNKRLNTDDDAIGTLYYNNGYVFFHAEPTETNIKGDSIDLEIRIREGQQAHFNKVTITGNTRLYENVIRRELQTKPGDLFSMDAIKRSVMRINQLQQFDAAALSSAMSKAIKPDPSNGTVDITYPLQTKGSDQVQLSVGWGPQGITGQAGIKFSNFSIQNLFHHSIKRAGFIPQGDGQTLALNVQTNGTYYQSYSISFIDPWFGGRRPNQFSTSFYYTKQTDVNSSYYNQNILRNGYYGGYGYGYGGYGVADYGYGYGNYYDPDKYVKQLSFSVGFAKRLRWPDDLFTVALDLSYTRYILKNWRYFIISNGKSNNINATLSLSRNSTDNAFYPREGSELLLSVSATPPYSLFNKLNYRSLGQNPESSNYEKEIQKKYRWIEYNKWKFKFRTFTALTNSQKPFVLMTRTEFGILGSYGKGLKSPFETFYMGGDGMSGYSYGYATETIGLRGYENGSIAGYNGNNAYAYSRMSLELRYPVLLEGSTNLYVLGFLEGGNAWYDVKNFNPFNIKSSAGVGVRISLPMIGMLGIDWAYGFQKYDGGRKIGGSQFHFILNQEF